MQAAASASGLPSMHLRGTNDSWRAARGALVSPGWKRLVAERDTPGSDDLRTRHQGRRGRPQEPTKAGNSGDARSSGASMRHHGRRLAMRLSSRAAPGLYYAPPRLPSRARRVATKFPIERAPLPRRILPGHRPGRLQPRRARAPGEPRGMSDHVSFSGWVRVTASLQRGFELVAASRGHLRRRFCKCCDDCAYVSEGDAS